VPIALGQAAHANYDLFYSLYPNSITPYTALKSLLSGSVD
jgi:hypothetical protein